MPELGDSILPAGAESSGSEDKVRYVKESEGVEVPEHLRDLYQRATRGLMQLEDTM